MKQRIKVCGLTRLEDAVLSTQLGAWALGFIFYPQSPRYVAPETVRKILTHIQSQAGVTPHAVGVFVNAKRDEIAHTIGTAGLSAIQLHGDESVADCRGWDVPVWKAFRIKTPEDVDAMALYATEVPYLVMDAAVAGSYGGTGQLADWGLAQAAVKRFPGQVILSGGLNPENVQQAVQQVRPVAVDLASGVEARPGEKSAAKLQALFAAFHKE